MFRFATAALLSFACAEGLAATAAEPQAERLAAAFVARLQRDDIRALEELGVDLSDTARTISVRSLFDRHQAIEAELLRVAVAAGSSDSSGADIELAGSAAIIGPSGRRVPLARCWTLQFARDGGRLRLTSALTREDWLAAERALASSAELDRTLADESCIRPEVFLAALADRASDQGPDGLATIAWAEKVARERRWPGAEAAAARMRSYVQTTQSPAAALESARDALRIATRADDATGIAGARFSIAVAHWFAGDLDEAARWFRSTADHLDETDDPLVVLRALHMAIHLDAGRKSMRTVLQRCDELRALLERYDAPRSRMDLEFVLNGVHARLRNLEAAADYSRRALASARAIGEVRFEAMALHNLAADLMELDDLPAARQALDEARKLATRDDSMRAEILNLKGTLARLQGQPRDAQEAFEAAIALSATVGERISEANGRHGMALLALDRGQAEPARAEAQRALELILGPPGPSRLQETKSTWGVRTTLGRALRALDRDAQAEQTLRLAIAEIEDLRLGPGEALGRSTALEQTASTHAALLELLVEQDRTEEALDVAESTKARALRDALAQGQVDRSRGVSEADRSRETELETALASVNRKLITADDSAARAALEPELAAARAQLRQFRGELFLRHPRLPLIRAEDSPDWSAAALPAGTHAVEFVVLPERTLAFVLRRKDGALAIDMVAIPIARDELRRQVEALADRIGSRNPLYKQQAAALYARLVQPLVPLLEGAQAIAAVPDDVLWRLPIPLLLDDTPLAKTPVFRAPSLRALAAAAALPAPSDRPPRLLAVGNPRVAEADGRRARLFRPDVDLGALPEAAREARAIARLYGSARSTVLTGAAARESAIEREAADYDVIHLATHGLLDDRAPIHSALVLASGGDDPTEDGLLEAREIADLSLRARLVVLSACDTGRGRVGFGEGLIGVSWAFMAAGVATVVVSDWKADSEAAEALMVEFHRQLLEGERPARALQRAQDALRRDPRFAHPYYWAPFTVVGVGS